MGLAGARRDCGAAHRAHGWARELPAAIVCGASTPEAWTWTGTLGEVGAADAAGGRAGRAGRRRGDVQVRDALSTASAGARDEARDRRGEVWPSLMIPRRSGARVSTSPTSATSTSSSTCSASSSAGEISPEDWRRFRLVRGTYGQRQDNVQMLRIKIPQGILDRLADAGAGRRGAALLARLLPRHDASEHPVPLRAAQRSSKPSMRELADEGPDDARSVRQLGAQHHRLPVRRDVARARSSTSRRMPRR